MLGIGKMYKFYTSNNLKIYKVKRKITFEFKLQLIPRPLIVAGWKIKAELCVESRSPDQLIPSALEASQPIVPGGYRLIPLASGSGVTRDARETQCRCSS